MMVVLDATIVNIALPKIQHSLHFSPSNLSWVINGYILAFGGLLLLGSRCGDIFGRRRVFIVGISIFTVASLVGGLATSSGMLLAARAVQGSGAALAAPSALALLMTMFEEGRDRTQALGWYTAVSIGGSAVGLVAGGMLVEWASWRWVMFVNVPIGVFAVLVGRAVLTETPRRPGRFDLLGALTSTSGAAALTYAFVEAAAKGWSNAVVVGSFAAGVTLIAAFVIVERRAAEPITPLRLFSSRDRNASYIARLCLVAGMQGMFFFITQFMQDVLLYSPLRTGLAFLPFTLVVFVASQVAARTLNGRVNPKALLVFGISLSSIGMFWVSHISQSSSYVAILLPILTFALVNGLAMVPLTAASLAGVRPEDAGAGSGMVNMAQQVGGALGLSVIVSVFGSAGRLLATHGRSPAADHAFTVGVDRGFFTAFLFVVATLVLLITLLRGSHLAAPGRRIEVAEAELGG